MRRFAGIDLGDDAIPDETTILHFRHLLERHKLTEKIFDKTRHYLSDKGLLLRKGTIVDATIINAPSSTKNRERSRDAEMKQTKKGNRWYFGIKARVGTDTGRGLVQRVVVTKASVHDYRVMDDLLHGEETAVYADEAKRMEYKARGVEWRINRKGKRGYLLSEEDRELNHTHNRIRAKVEHAFMIVKCLWNYRKVRYKGLAKNAAQVFNLFALANLYLV